VVTTLTQDVETLNEGGWTTSDGGRTWQPIVRRPVGTVARPPAGTLFLPVIGHTDGPTREAALYPDGHLDIVTSVPVGLSGGGRPTDVPVYAYGGDRADVVWVSTDQAATWHRATMPVDSAHETVELLGGVGDPQYAFVPPTVIGGPERILASADHGLTWTEVAVPARTPVIVPSGTPDEWETYDTTSAALTSDGGVLLNDGARTWRLAPGATAFTPADQRFPIVSLEQVGPNVVATSADLRRAHPVVTHWLTGDGIRWQRVNW
jgi:hypothetical protein